MSNTLTINQDPNSKERREGRERALHFLKTGRRLVSTVAPTPTPKPAPPWNLSSEQPPPNVGLVFFDGLNFHTGVWSPRMGEKGGFATVTRTTRTTKLHYVENVVFWMLIPECKPA